MVMINKDSIRSECDNLANTLIKKNHDYGNSVQDQFKEYGLTSILIRLDDKMKRLKTLRTLDPQVADESLKDTLQDLAGYSVLGLMCLKEQEQTIEPVKTVDARIVPSTEDWIKLQHLREKYVINKPPYADLDDE